jgi:metallo-beta-lactamase family protein
MDDMCNDTKFVATPDESRRVAALDYPSIIIAGSGMATGGRILHHLKAYASDARNSIVFPGFQVPGTRGAKILAGDRQTKIHGQYVTVSAQVHQLEAPAQTYIVHGERDAADTLRLRIADELHWPVATVEHLQSVVA